MGRSPRRRSEDEPNPLLAVFLKGMEVLGMGASALRKEGEHTTEAKNPFSEVWQRFLEFIRFLWIVLREWGGVLSPCRFSALVVLLAALILFKSEQGREFAIGLIDNFWIAVWYLVIVVLCGLQTWLWARTSLTRAFSLSRTHRVVTKKETEARAASLEVRQKPATSPARAHHHRPIWRRLTAREQWMVSHTPRTLGASVPAVAGLALAIQAWRWFPSSGHPSSEFYRYSLLTGISLVSAAGLYVVFWLRSSGTARSKIGKIFFKFLPENESNTDELKVYQEFNDLPIMIRRVYWISLVLFVITGTVAVFWPWLIGEMFGALPILLLAMTLIVPIGTRLVFSSIDRGWPVVTSLFLWAVLVSFLPFADNHTVRVIGPPREGAPKPSDRQTIELAADEWYKRASQADDRGRGTPLIIVATAGGGSRAAYWTATVLGTLQDELPRFADHVFAISAVSGGSLGAATFVSLLAGDSHRDQSGGYTTEDEQATSPKVTTFATCAQNLLGLDFLTPLMGSFFFPDLVQRFIPLGFPDRAEAIEKAWENSWRRTVEIAPCTSRFAPNRKDRVASDRFAEPFLSLWSKTASGRVPPALFLNGTHEESGKRIITSNVKVDPATFLDAYDFYDLVEGDVRVSTAVNNSARFTYVQPAGTLRSNGHNNGHILDGGYFENFGAITASQIARRAVDHLRHQQKAVMPIVLQISSDPEIKDEAALPRCAVSVPPQCGRDQPPVQPGAGAAGANELSAPVFGILNTRTARGVLAAKELCQQTAGINEPQSGEEECKGATPRFFHFRLCEQPDYPQPALGWTLAKRTQENLQAHLRTCGNEQQKSSLLNLLKSQGHGQCT